jgi:protein gp37
VKNWNDPVRWNAKEAAFFAEHGRRQRVFCASMADVFDNEVDPMWRADLFQLISDTPNLDWLLLTKRIGNAKKMLPVWYEDPEAWPHGNGVAHGNVWIGATIVNQEEADRDIPKLLEVPAAKRFLSMEPLLGPVNLMTMDIDGHSEIYPLKGTTNCVDDDGAPAPDLPALDWVIVGGESGHNARPMHPEWVRNLRDQCTDAGVKFLFKQWGEWGQYVNESHYTHGGAEKNAHAWVDSETAEHGLCWVIDDDGSWSNWTGEPRKSANDDEDERGSNLHAAVSIMGLHGKKAAGRLLDGVAWDEVPK